VKQQLEERKGTKQSQVLTGSWLWSGSGLVVVWIGSGSVWIGPEVDPRFCACCGLDAVRQEKHDMVCRQQVDSLAAWQPQCQLGSLTAWTRNSSSLAAGLLDCLAA